MSKTHTSAKCTSLMTMRGGPGVGGKKRHVWLKADKERPREEAMGEVKLRNLRNILVRPYPSSVNDF